MSIIECIDGQDNFNSCFIGLPKCSDDNPCPIHHLAAPLRNQMIQTLKNESIAEFIKDHLTCLNGGPSFSPDGNRIYFYSTGIEGGFGKKDV